MNVLLTSAGRRVELVRAFRAAYDRLDMPGRIIAVDVDPLAPALSVADEAYVVPRLTSPDYVPTLRAICEREYVKVVFPLIDPDIPVLARNRDELAAIGTMVAVPECTAAAIAADKWDTCRFFASIGVRGAQSWLPGDPALADAAYPLFIKPRRGSASQHTFRVDSAEQLAFFSGYVPDPIVQEFVEGYEVTTDVVCGVDGTLLGMVSRRRMEVRSGEVMKGVTVRDDAILDDCARIAAALPAGGPLTVQCIVRGGVPYFTEINARFGGGLPLGIAAGVDAPALVLAHSCTGVAPTTASREYRTGLYVSRFDDSFFVTEDDRARLASRHL